MANDDFQACFADNGLGVYRTGFADEDAPRAVLLSIIDGPKHPGS